MKKSFYWVIGIAATPFVIFILLTLLLYCPPVQRWAVGIATRYASEATDMEISIEDVSLRFPIDLKLNGVRALHRNDSLPQVKDTIIDARGVLCDIRLRPLFSGKVEVNALNLDNVTLNTNGFVPDCRVKGKVGQLTVVSHGIDLKNDSVLINKARLAHADLDICLSDTAQEDTTKSETPWLIKAKTLDITQSRIKLHMPGDTLNITAEIGALGLRNGSFDLKSSEYRLASATLAGSRLLYDNRFETKVKGLDYNHIDISRLNISIAGLLFRQNERSYSLSLLVRDSHLYEKSGLTVKSLKTKIDLDTAAVHVNGLSLTTPYSTVNGNVDFDFTTFAASNPGKTGACIDASLGREDIMIFAAAYLPKELRHLWPKQPATIKGCIDGNMKSMEINDIAVNIPTLMSGTVTGTLRNLDSGNSLSADARLKLRAVGNNGSVSGKVAYNMRGETYMAKLDIHRLNLGKFLPGQGLGILSGDISVSGKGTDIYSKRTDIKAAANIRSFRYGRYDLSGSRTSMTLRNGIAHAEVHTPSKILDTDLVLDAQMIKRGVKGSISGDIRNIDLYALHITDVPLATSMKASLSLASDMNDRHAVSGNIYNFTLRDSASTYNVHDVNIDAMTRLDTTHVSIECGDLAFKTDFSMGYKKLMNLGNALSGEIKSQLSNRVIDEIALRNKFPEGRIFVRADKDNPVSRMLKSMGYAFSSVYTDMEMSPAKGINGEMQLDTLIAGGIRLDNIHLSLLSEEEQMNYRLTVQNGKDNPQYSFKAETYGALRPNSLTLAMALDDKTGRRGFDLGLSAMMTDNGIKVTIDSDKPVLGYRKFSVNKDNYIAFNNDMRVSANVQLKDNADTGIQIYTDDKNATALQDVTVSVTNLNLADIISVVPYMPDIKGIANGDYHIILNKEDMSISANMDIRQFTYEGYSLGNLSTEVVYMPLSDGSHHIDGILYKDDNEVATVQGSYFFLNGGDRIDAEIDMKEMPLNLVNGFIPDQIIGLEGTAVGHLTIKGELDMPEVNGTADLSHAQLVSVPYGVKLKMDSKPVTIENSNVRFDDFRLFDSNNQPLTVNGTYSFADLGHMRADMLISAKNILVVDAKESRNSLAYGKAYINFLCSVKGEVDALQIRGGLEVLPTTDLYYILRDSPITTDNRLKELVEFTDFTNKETTAPRPPAVNGISVDLNISIQDGSHITCWLNTNHSNYLDIIGNGSLRFLYRGEDMSMTGRYTISQGEMKYSLPVIPLKTFTISQDSYIEFTGDIMNPKLAITATEDVRANVSTAEGNRTVEFRCGVVLSKTLNDMGLQFLISAPEDQSVTDQLNMMSVEERGKIAVTMLTTGMFLAGDSSSKISMNSALSNFLQSQINSITGSAMRTLDLSVGLENSIREDGTMRTDYAFKFAKRFWNNRLSVSLGGKIATGSEADGKTASIFDNVEMQYRLHDTSNQYLRLFYKHDVYDHLEGYVDQFGAGYMYKRKFSNLYELFHPSASQTDRKKKQETDSANIKKDSINAK
ncbi:MAG: translocation/assembly module TamB [Bacteroidales bacterium]|nr:translocation/assembly module TamB [Bacteroidales bacterium]MCM1147898.1 translocation/assembly module TamB [Bacteroidales bacterium]MCM1205447.1 translocation/assembly module TamB [Bacillota bacterium]MCM1509291.1 translocation/assembly module TamB [Clostridium sp.]